MTEAAGKYLLVLTNAPDHETAIKLANLLVGKRLAACVNVLGGCTSVYRWQDGIETEPEIPLLIKTHVDRFSAVQEEILNVHPYELPEIVAVPIECGLKPYLDWVASSLDLSR
ncbi:MAG TPA: divalent-cation tolerance protein CutA [Burkholderiales bacterium]|nr:divalent-cation tolerance protein CutA [Burkholderiales bacterium]